MAKGAAAAAIGLGILGSIANTVAAQLEKAGRVAIEQGGGSGTFIAGKVLSGAGTGGIGGGIAGGALAGTGVLPGIGTGIGALIGGVVGAFGGGLYGARQGGKEAINIRNVSEFNKELEITTSIFKDVSEGLTTFDVQQTRLISGINDTRNRLYSVSAEAAQDIRANFKQQVDNYEQLFRSIAKGSKTFDEFYAKLGDGTFENFAELIGQPLKSLRESFTLYIQHVNEAAASQLKASKAAEAFANNIRNLVTFGTRF